MAFTTTSTPSQYTPTLGDVIRFAPAGSTRRYQYKVTRIFRDDLVEVIRCKVQDCSVIISGTHQVQRICHRDDVEVTRIR